MRALLLLLAVSGPTVAGQGPIEFPTGTTLAVRFLGSLHSGHDRVGTPVMVQTLAPLATEGCVAVAAYRRAAGEVVVSRSGRIFGGRGVLGLRFDSLEVAPHRWIRISAVLDSLEYTPAKNLTDSGLVYGAHASLAGRAVPAGVVGIMEIAPLPTVLFAGYWLGRRGPAAQIVPGEIGAMRFTEPVRIADAPCGVAPTRASPPPSPGPFADAAATGTAAAAAAASSSPATVPLADLPAFDPWSEPKNGRGAGDPLNLLFFGTAAQLDSAFRRAGWVGPVRGSIRTVTGEIVAGIENRPAVGAPLKAQYFRGRRQDLAYQLAGPTARSRHHVRLWLLDSLSSAWVGAANQDVGVEINPFIGRFTHRINPAIDAERDRIVKELEATGCGALVRYEEEPGAVKEGRNAIGQPFVTDGRTAVIEVHACPPLASTLANKP